MKILGYKSGGHDGSVCALEDGKLIYSIEGEKDGGSRHCLLANGELEEILARYGTDPDVVCGDSHFLGSPDVGSYHGISFSDIKWSKGQIKNREVDYASVPHELAHITGSIAMSDLPHGQPCYALVWEGYHGSFYYVDEELNISRLGNKSQVLDFPGVRYIMPYHATGKIDVMGHSAAGKIMAIAGLKTQPNTDYSREKKIAKMIVCSHFAHEAGRVQLNGDWLSLYESLAYLKDTAVDDHRFVALCRALQDEIFNTFHDFALAHIEKKIPLIISGGCGLNCEWNTKWIESGLFSSVFVPPVTSDSGIAIGAAAAVQFLKTRKIKLDWNVYAGEAFIHETPNIEKFGFKKYPLNFDHLTRIIYDEEKVIAWVQGRYEFGPRALCNRSLIASPLTEQSRNELNRIKRREYFRPVAPACLEEDVAELFEWDSPSPYMLFFQKVRRPELKAVTHFDGTARVQTINSQQNPIFHQLLNACKQKSGFGVLCNTSLNFPGQGFLNRTSQLLDYIDQTGISVFVIDEWIYVREDMIADK